MAYLLPLVLSVLSCASVRVQISGCPCTVSRHTVVHDYERADAVFVGTVVSMNPAPAMENPARKTRPRVIAVHIDVLNRYKGDVSGNVSLYIDTYWSCAYAFIIGETYLVYAWNEHRFKNRLTTTACVRTALFADAKKDIRKLRKIRAREKRR